MSRRSHVYPLPIMFRNESKHEDCMVVMDSYEEQLITLHNLALGKWMSEVQFTTSLHDLVQLFTTLRKQRNENDAC